MKLRSDILNYISCILFPNRCIFCGELLPADADGICKGCRKDLLWIKGETCPYCGAEIDNCMCGKKHGNFYDATASVFYYRGNVRKCIHRFKFDDDKSASRELGRLMAQTSKRRFEDVQFDYVAYVPMDKKSERKRGYNQSKLLAREVAKRRNIPFGDELILKIYRTGVQHDKNHIERKGNLLGAFDINSRYDIKGKTILLVDDVKTSGATLNECGKMLYLYGAERVFCLTTALVNSKIKTNDLNTKTEGIPCSEQKSV